ncbi:hypothetical protein N9B31_10005, partial [Mariniblastus sp.]|nr:hypothetical protein [Mariniblastus sp.]
TPITTRVHAIVMSRLTAVDRTALRNVFIGHNTANQSEICCDYPACLILGQSFGPGASLCFRCHENLREGSGNQW